MQNKRKSFWITISLVNLCMVALLGVILRSKIVFSLPFIDYRNVLNAHSHVAFTGWAGLGLITLLIYDLLPPAVAQQRFYQWILISTQVSTVGMLLTFPVWGYTAPSIVFSSLYIVVSFVLAPVLIKDLMRYGVDRTVRLLSTAAITSLLVSAIGPFLLVFIMISKSTNALLYRDSVYTFLHFQYNGFFTLAVFALLLHHALKKGLNITVQARSFAVFLCASVVPSLALSLLWHNSGWLYVVAAIGCVLILVAVSFFFSWIKTIFVTTLLSTPLAHTLWWFSAFSFGLKMLLQVGTIVPELGQVVYGDRPVIIGFLHLVFLGFLTFYILAALVEYGSFKKLDKTVLYPFIVFGAGIISNEPLLMLQGLGMLFETTTHLFNWLLWGGSLLLLAGAVLLATVHIRIHRRQRL